MKIIIPIILIIINSVLMHKLAIFKTDSFLFVIFINALPLLPIIFPGFFAAIMRIGVWQSLASDYDQGVPQAILVLLGWISLIIIFILLLISYFNSA